jgi:alcohol dehydrogenase YqhD (iron-dependent ADH family)
MSELDLSLNVIEEIKPKKPKKVLKFKEKKIVNAKEKEPNSIMQETLAKLEAKFEVLENEISVKDQKLAQLENAQKTLKVGDEEFGTGRWRQLTRGKEKGYIRNIYIDVTAMAGLSKPFQGM